MENNKQLNELVNELVALKPRLQIILSIRKWCDEIEDGTEFSKYKSYRFGYANEHIKIESFLATISGSIGFIGGIQGIGSYLDKDLVWYVNENGKLIFHSLSEGKDYTEAICIASNSKVHYKESILKKFLKSFPEFEKAFYSWCDYTGVQPAVSLEEQIEKIKKPPWVKISERYPTKEEYNKDNGWFLLTDRNRLYGEQYDIYDDVFYDDGHIGPLLHIDNRAIAWMSLPEIPEELRKG